MLMGFDLFLAQVRGYRMVWLPGRFSGGKTAMACRMAWDMKKRWGYRIVSNTSFILNEQEEPDFIIDEYGNASLKLVVIIDEGGLYLTDNKTVMRWMSFAGKMDIIAIVPSFYPPASLMRSLEIQKVHHYRAIGVPNDVYKWEISMGRQKFDGKVQWFGMEEIYGTYSTLHPSVSAEAVIAFVEEKSRQYQERYSKIDQSNWLSAYEPDYEDTAFAPGSSYNPEIGLLENAAWENAKAAEQLATVLDGAESRRGRRRLFGIF